MTGRRLTQFAEAAREIADKAKVAAQPYVEAATAKAYDVKDQATARTREVLEPLAERAANRVDQTVEDLTAALNRLTIALDDKTQELQIKNAAKKEELRDQVAALKDQLLAFRMATAKPESETDYFQRISAEVDKVVPRAQAEETAAPKVVQTATLNPFAKEMEGTRKVAQPVEPIADQDDVLFAGLAEMFKYLGEIMPDAPKGVTTGKLLDLTEMETWVKTKATPAPSHVRPLKLNEQQLAEALEGVQTALEAAYPKTKAADAPTAKAPVRKKSGPTRG